MENRKEYISKVIAKLKEWDNEITKLEEKVGELSAEAKADFQKQINELKKKKEPAQQKLRISKDVGEDAWKDLKINAELTWDSFENSVKKIWSKFKE